MAKCDLCGEKCAANKMTSLRDRYRVEGVDDICEDCARWANAVKNAALAAVEEHVKEAIRRRLGKNSQES